MEIKELILRYIKTSQEITWEDYCVLFLINSEEIDLLSSIFNISSSLELLENKSYIKKINDNEYYLLKKGLDLFPCEDNEYSFELFWNEYYKITPLPKTDKDATEKYWKRLKSKEKKKAIENIQSYYDSLNDKKYCVKARTYLANKRFNDEFSNTITNDWTRKSL